MNVHELTTQLAHEAGWRSLRAAQSALAGMSLPARMSVARFLNGDSPAARSDYAARTVRLGLASDGSLDNLAAPLALRLLERGMFGAQHQAPFAQLAQEVRIPDSGLLRHNADIVVLAPWLELWTRVVKAPAADAQTMFDEGWRHVTALRERFQGVILVVNVIAPESRRHGILDPRGDTGFADLARAMNLMLSRRCREGGNAHVLDADLLSHQSATRWPSLHKGRWMSSRAFDDGLADQIAADIAAFAAALRGFSRKCLALDLDNTLWGGVVGEDGVSGLRIGGAYPGSLYTGLQQEVQNLAARGVTLTLLSKNNEADAWEVFDQRPEMVLRRADISAHRINWQDKAANLRELAAELNLGLDAFVVLDDNPVERAWIEEALPEVEVCPASDPLEMLRWITTCRRFDTLSVTEEDALRARSYEASARRAEVSAAAGDLASYLASLDTEVEVGLLTAAQGPRVAQLTQKTNQFNLTTRRHSETEVLGMMNSPDWRIFWCRCRDRFADEGIIGAAFVSIEGMEWKLDTFLMSCRVLGRGVEKSFLHAICTHAAGSGARSMTGEYLRTAKNGLAESFYESCGFTAQERTPERGLWRMALPLTADLNPPWITLHTSDSMTPINALP